MDELFFYGSSKMFEQTIESSVVGISHVYLPTVPTISQSPFCAARIKAKAGPCELTIFNVVANMADRALG